MLLPIIYFCIIVINSIAFLSGKKIKWIYIPSYIFLMIFAVGIRLDSSFLTYDLSNYQYEYDYINSSFSLELGYNYIVKLCTDGNLSFEAFHAILTCLIIICMIIAVKRIGGNPHLIIFSWLIYFIIITPNQLRNQSALAIMMLMVFPFYMKKKRRKIWVFLGLLLSVLFHTSFVAFIIPVVLCYFSDEKLRLRKVWFLVCIIVFVFLMFSPMGKSIGGYLMILGVERYEGYGESHTGFSSLLILAIYLLTIYAIVLHKKREINNKGEENGFIYENIDVFHKFLIYSCYLLPLLLLNTTFYRFFRDLSFIAIAYLGINSTVKSINLTKRLQTFFMVFAIALGWFFFDVVIKGYWPEYTRYFFDINLL